MKRTSTQKVNATIMKEASTQQQQQNLHRF